MSLHDELLTTAEYLTRRNNKKPTEADRRRAVSTAYYALFHRLIDAAVSRLSPAPGSRAALARAFEHGRMKSVCQKVVKLAAQAAEPGPRHELYPLFALVGWPVPDGLQRVATAFAELQERRHDADYNRSFHPTREVAQEAIKQARDAFDDLAAVESAPPGQAFLLLLLLGEPRAR